MYCLQCEYDLSGLKAGPCPECGRVFDPVDSASYSFDQRRGVLAQRVEISLVVVATTPLVANALAFVSLVRARIALGRWPHRGGMDDPKEIAGIEQLTLLAVVTLMASIMVAVFAILLVLALAMNRAWHNLLRGGLIAVSLWIGGFALARWDPAQAWMWIFD